MDDVYTLPVPGGALVASPSRSVFALVNGPAARALGRGEAHPALQELEAALAAPPAAPERRDGAFLPAFLGIIPTRGCNLACVYCGFGAATAPGRRMRVETAVAAVDWMAETMRAAGEAALEVHFFGGEPLVAGEVVDAAVHRARIVAARMDLTPRLEISTNGVCSESRARFLADYFDAVVLSLDGPREIQDRHRPMRGGGTFDAVARTARILRDSSTDLCLRACVTGESVAALEEIVEWFCDEFQPGTIDLETLQPTAESDAAGLTPPDPCDFAAHCVRAMRVARSHGVELTYSAAETGRLRQTFCPVGRDTAIVSPDGAISSCYLLPADWQRRGLDLDIGAIDDDGSVSIDLSAASRIRDMVAGKPSRCAGCFCRQWCAGGCHVNHSYPGCPDARDAFCVQTRIITACSLLERLGASEAVDRLIGDRGAMLELGGPAPHPSPRSAPPPHAPTPAADLPQGELAARASARSPYAITARGLVAFAGGGHRVLEDAEAALWDLLARGYRVDAATRLIGAIACMDAAGADRLVRTSLAEWKEAGLIEEADG